MAFLFGKLYNADDKLPTAIEFYLTTDVTFGNSPVTAPNPSKVKATGTAQADKMYGVTLAPGAYHAWLPSVFGGRWATRLDPPDPHPPNTVLVTEPLTEYNWRAPGSKLEPEAASAREVPPETSPRVPDPQCYNYKLTLHFRRRAGQPPDETQVSGQNEP